MGLVTLPGFEEESDDPDPDQVLRNLQLPEIENAKVLRLPCKGEVPFLDDFDDSGLGYFLDQELDKSKFNIME
jgi:hypothetical protein